MRWGEREQGWRRGDWTRGEAHGGRGRGCFCTYTSLSLPPNTTNTNTNNTNNTNINTNTQQNNNTTHQGIIYVSDSELGWEPIAKSWLARRPDAAQSAALAALFDKYVARCLEWLRVSTKPVMGNEVVCHVSTLLTLLSASLKK